MKYFLASALCLLVSTACSGNKKSEANVNVNKQTSEEQAAVNTDGKALVSSRVHLWFNHRLGCGLTAPDFF